jgi:hypothetical protein
VLGSGADDTGPDNGADDTGPLWISVAIGPGTGPDGWYDDEQPQHDGAPHGEQQSE